MSNEEFATVAPNKPDDDLSSTESLQSVLTRAAALLDAFEGSEELNLAQLAHRAGLPRSSVHRLLQRLVDLEWVERQGFRYRLGVRMCEFGNHAFHQDSLHRSAIRPMYDLRQETGFNVHLCVLAGSESVAIESLWGHRQPPLLVRNRLPARATACGRVLLSALPHTSLEPLFGPTEALTIRADVTEVRDRGYAVSYDVGEPGMVSVAVPIGPTGSVRTALTVTAPGREIRIDKAVHQLRHTAARAWRDSRARRSASSWETTRRP